jgi:hypothetical protein
MRLAAAEIDGLGSNHDNSVALLIEGFERVE